MIVLGCALGLAAAVRGLMDSMKIMQKIGEEGEKKPDTVSFNDHE